MATNPSYGDTIFGARELVVLNTESTDSAPINAFISMAVTLDMTSSDLQGDDIIYDTKTFPKKGAGEFSAGTFSTAALSIMLGESFVTTGASPSEKTEITINAGTDFPYFQIRGRALANNGSDAHIYVYKAVITDVDLFSISNEEWRVTSMSFSCLDDGTNGIFSIVQNETAAALPLTAV